MDAFEGVVVHAPPRKSY